MMTEKNFRRLYTQAGSKKFPSFGADPRIAKFPGTFATDDAVGILSS